jgi:2-polyprenyl-6-methoxyphenol hydroxylase-like FAD-dependent oxidoreductase
MPAVLISGASIAGPSVAYWLQRHGFAVTVIERSPGLRPGGQPIDIRGVALEVVAEMRLKAQVEARRTRIAGANVLDRNGHEIMRHTDRTLSAGRHDSGDIEIFRDDLAALLYEATRTSVDYRFNDAITAIDDGESKVAVAFKSGPTRDFDLVIGADGVYSGVRRLVFGPSERFLKYLGAYVAIFTAPNFLELEDWQTAIGDESGGSAAGSGPALLQQAGLPAGAAAAKRRTSATPTRITERTKPWHSGPRLRVTLSIGGITA